MSLPFLRFSNSLRGVCETRPGSVVPRRGTVLTPTRRWPRAAAPVVWAAALFLVAFPAPSAHAQPFQGAQAGPVQLDFQDVDLSFVMSGLAQMAGVNLIYHDLPAKTVTLRTQQPVPRGSIMSLIRSLAAANGVSVVEDGGFVRLIGSGQAGEPDNRQLFIYRLKHARATVLGSTLQALFGGAATGGGNAGVQRQTLSQQLNALQAPQQQTVQVPQIVVGGPGSGALQGNVLIVPDEVTNSLLIRATPTDWQTIEQAVTLLDLRPLQVVIEVVIAEVRHTNDLDVGLSFQGSRASEDVDINGELPPGANLPTDPFTVTFGGIQLGSVDIEATLATLSASGRVRILSRPVILAQNNQEARILVGTQQPFVQISQSSVIDPNARSEVVQYREVGTVLTILPTINVDGYVNLAVAQEVSSATTQTQFGAPIISTREAETQLLARNGQTVVIGGLVDEQVSHSRQGIPLLKDIPIIGLLFGTTKETRGSSELFLFLTPYIVATDEDADRMLEQVETGRELLDPLMPIVPITPPVEAPPAGAGVVPPPATPPPALPAAN